jgi:uncharacterized membrane protein
MVKTLLWRAWCFISGFVLLLLMGQPWQTATAYTIIINLFLTVSYYVYDRIWDGIKWGVKK